MDFALTEELQMVRDMAKDFAEREILPNIEEDEKNHRFRPELVKKMGELGFFGTVVPEEYGGNPELGFLGMAVMAEEVARVSASWGLPFNMQTVGPGTILLKFGNEEQRKKYLPGLVSGELLGCFAITEPNSGSDVASMKTTAKKVDDGYILNGQKMWISNAHVADVTIVFAYTDTDAKPKHRGMSCFVIDMKDNPGIETKAIESKLGLFCAPTGEIAFTDAKIPLSALVGEEGSGFKQCMTMLDRTRISCASRAVGVARACLEESAKYALERTQFGKPIAEFEIIQDELAQMSVHYEAARLLVHKAAWLTDKGERCTREISTAKYYSAEAAVANANEAMKIFGSYGYSSEYPAERYLRDSKSYQVVEGTSNIQKIIIASYVLGKRS
jgi:glutaryl-CoA dehydrogenase (non-decarboxylating)